MAVTDQLIASSDNRAKKYVRFVEQKNQKDKKTKVWHIIGVRDGDVAGLIKWAGNWRKYVFYIDGMDGADSYYDWDCLRLIADFCEAATKDHRTSK